MRFIFSRIFARGWQIPEPCGFLIQERACASLNRNGCPSSKSWPAEGTAGCGTLLRPPPPPPPPPPVRASRYITEQQLLNQAGLRSPRGGVRSRPQRDSPRAPRRGRGTRGGGSGGAGAWPAEELAPPEAPAARSPAACRTPPADGAAALAAALSFAAGAV